MSDPQLLDYLRELVAADTQNPPRTIELDHPLFRFLSEWAAANRFSVETVDHGEGRVAWWARRGQPSVLFNVHLDTVPAAREWQGDPLTLQVTGERAIGLGACDTKGAAACLLSLAAETALPLSLLFTTDEEGSQNCCVARFVASHPDLAPGLVVVAEPTEARVVLGHRGYLSALLSFAGVAAHTSSPRATRRSAVHALIDWGGEALQAIDALERSCNSPIDLCFNVGVVRGGVKNNIVAEQAELRWSARPPAGFDPRTILDRLQAIPAPLRTESHVTFAGAGLPAQPESRAALAARIGELGLEVGEDVPFWTEASIFSAAGWPTIVLGPGNIAQAHSAYEWVRLADLQAAKEAYRRIAESKA